MSPFNVILLAALLGASSSSLPVAKTDSQRAWEKVFAEAGPLELGRLSGQEVCLINPAGNSNAVSPTVGIYFNAGSNPIVASANAFPPDSWCLEVVAVLRKTSAALARRRSQRHVIQDVSDAVRSGWRRVYRQRGQDIIVRSEVMAGDGSLRVSYQAANIERHRVPCTCSGDNR
jgi:hypothetical protein